MEWLWVLAAFLAFFVKGVCGFANTLVFTTVLNFGTSNVNISPVDLTLTYPANILMTVKERRSLKWNICVPMAIIVVLGSIPGMLILKNADVTFVKILFGIATVLVALEILFRSKAKKDKNGSSKIFGLGIGILSGILCGLYGVGALLGAYISRETDNISEFKANFSFVLL